MTGSNPSSAEGNADDNGWRDRILASLSECRQPLPARSRLKSFLSSLGALLIVALTWLVGQVVLPEILRNAKPPVGAVVGVIWLAFAILVLARIRNALFRHARRVKARSAEAELQRAEGKRPILYLRSFRLDTRLQKTALLERLLGTVPLASAEQEITNLLSRCGPVIAIGRPGETLPPLGAARFYVPHDRWQEKVEEVAAASQLVVWASGVTEGLQWEIRHLLGNLPPHKLILWAHPHLLKVGGARREEEWAQFLKVLGDQFPHPLPPKLGSTRFFRFEDDWKPVPVAPDRRLQDFLLLKFLSPQESALKALLRAKPESPEILEQRRQRRRRVWRRIGYAAVSIIALALVVAWWKSAEKKAERDEYALENMAGSLVLDEYPHLGGGTPSEILEKHRQSATSTFAAASSRRMEEVRGLARDYLAIFETIHLIPALESLLYEAHPTRIAGLKDAAEALQRLEEIRDVRGKVAVFSKNLAAQRSRLGKENPHDYQIGHLEILTARRDAVLAAEEQLLQLLCDHPDAWQMVPESGWYAAHGIDAASSSVGDPLPLFADTALRNQFREMVRQRAAAGSALLTALKEYAAR